MDISRNQYFVYGFVLLFLGLQFRLVEAVELTPEASRVLTKPSASAPLAAMSDGGSSEMPTLVGAKKTIRPPEWLGWALISFGAVLLLHALAMPKSG